jgi:hypothetical protein
MAEKKKEVKVEDLSEVLKDISGLVKENYLLSLKIALSIWEESQEFANAQLERYLNGNLDRLVSAQRNYINLIRTVSDEFTKDTLSLAQKITEKAFSAFEKNLSLFKS